MGSQAMGRNRESVQSKQLDRRVIREQKSITKTESKGNGLKQYWKRIPKAKVGVNKKGWTGRSARIMQNKTYNYV